jgi:hypothetical protein
VSVYKENPSEWPNKNLNIRKDESAGMHLEEMKTSLSEIRRNII